MHRILMSAMLVAAGWIALSRRLAALNIFACEPEWGALAKELAGDKASIYMATTALQDPHRIEARPSLIARARSRRPGRVHRRRAGGRLAAARADAIGQSRRYSAGGRECSKRRAT